MSEFQSEIEASLLARTRQMSRNEMESILKRHGVTGNLDEFHNDDLADTIISLILNERINHAELM